MIINSSPENAENIRWWTEARFGMFVHFGLYALLQRGEWVMYREEIPRAEYAELRDRFNPSRFDADAWVGLAQDAGARYITVTAKHHDGFCLFDSALTDHKITNTPFKRDLIGELVEACQRADMRIVFYYSQPDWFHPSFVNRQGAFKEWQTARPEDAPDWEVYKTYLHEQVRELCTNYGRIDGFWWDGTHRSEADWGGRELYEMIKGYHPHAVVNDRARYGDFFTPERSIPELPVDVPCECCQSIHTKSWGYKEGGPYWSTPALIENLCRTSSLGANFLLNVGPKPDGTISEPEQVRMRQIGRWLETDGRAIYGTEGCALDTGTADIRATRNDNILYLHLLRWPETDWLRLPGVEDPPSSVRLLGNDCELRVEDRDGELCVGPLPSSVPGNAPTVLELDFDTAPALTLKPGAECSVPIVTVAANALTRLSVADARADGYGVKAARLTISERKREGEALPVVSNFLSEQQTLTWRVHCDMAGTYEVAVEARISALYIGSVMQVTVGDQVVKSALDVGPTGDDFTLTILGTVRLSGGEQDIVCQPEFLALGYTLGGAIRGLVLSP